MSESYGLALFRKKLSGKDKDEEVPGTATKLGLHAARYQPSCIAYPARGAGLELIILQRSIASAIGGWAEVVKHG